MTPAPSKCEIVTTQKSMNASYRAIDQYYNFAYADPSRTPCLIALDQHWKTIRSLYSNAIVIVLMTSKTIDGRIKSKWF